MKLKKLRVHVDLNRGMAEVQVIRRFALMSSVTDYAVVARIDLSADDADERLAEARMKARDMARQLNDLERT